MARTITALISGQSIGTGSNKGEGLFPQKLTLAAGATAFAIEAQVTNGTAGYRLKEEITVRYAVSSFDYTAAAAVANLRQTSRFVPLLMPANAGDIRARLSLLEPANGDYVYVWVECPTLETAASLTVNAIEHT